jgi:hypothetical protein
MASILKPTSLKETYMSQFGRVSLLSLLASMAFTQSCLTQTPCVFVACGEVVKNRWVTNQTDFVTATDPGFVNLAKGDFRLKKNSEVFTANPNFKPIPVENIGLLPNRKNRQ